MSAPVLTPWQRIMRAADRGTGLRLTADEVLRLSRDQAIEEVAANDDEDMRALSAPTDTGDSE